MIIKGIKLIVVLLILGLILFPVILFFFLMDDTPLISEHERLSMDNVQKVKDIISSIKPDNMNKKQIRAMALSENDLNTLLNYGVQHGLGYERLFTKIELPEKKAHAWVTLELPVNPAGKYLNVFISLKNNGAYLDVDHLKAGKLTIPGILINPAIRVGNHLLLYSELYKGLNRHVQAVKKITITKGYLNIVYEWDPSVFGLMHENGKKFLLSKEHQEKLVQYYNQLVQTLGPYRNKKVSLTVVLRPMFVFSAQQSKISNHPVLENTALFQVLSLYSIKRGLKDLVHEDLMKRMEPFTAASFTLYGRTDLPKHFLISAGLTVSAGSKLSNFIGLAKEVDDSDKGSGFSFADLAADKAGVRMGELAAGSPEKAVWLQHKMSEIEQETDFIPLIDDLPEGIRKLEFKKRYNDLDSKSYAMVNDEIDKRIGDCTVYRE
ncbi:MAG: hypothetical protein WC836_14930 [Desulfobacula sp.]